MSDPAGLQTARIALPGDGRTALEGAGRGPAVLLLHGVGGHRGQWRPQTRALSVSFGMIAPACAQLWRQ